MRERVRERERGKKYIHRGKKSERVIKLEEGRFQDLSMRKKAY